MPKRKIKWEKRNDKWRGLIFKPLKTETILFTVMIDISHTVNEPLHLGRWGTE